MGISNTIPPSRLIQPGVVANTAARPTSPFTGQAIYQVDTNQYLIWNGTAWTLPTNMPWGLVAYTKTTTSNITYTTETTAITSSAFTAVANRYYKATYIEGTTYGSVVAEASSRIRLDSISGTLIGVTRHILSNTASTLTTSTGLFTTTAGSHTVLGTLKAETGIGTAYRTDIGASIIVEDMGPV